MDQITLTRTGNRPLRFVGEQIENESTKWINGKQQNRWSEIGLYRTKNNLYVLAINYYTCWQGEQDHYRADIFDSIEDVAAYLRADDGACSRSFATAISRLLENYPEDLEVTPAAPDHAGQDEPDEPELINLPATN